MLSVWFGSLSRDDVLMDSEVDVYFNHQYEDDWFDDFLVKQMVLDVDKSEVVSSHCVISPVLGSISVTKISGGVKALILMYKTNLVVDASACGENCIDWIVRIGDLKDLTISLGYFMRINPNDNGIRIENDGSIVKSRNEYIGKMLDFLNTDGSTKENEGEGKGNSRR